MEKKIVVAKAKKIVVAKQLTLSAVLGTVVPTFKAGGKTVETVGKMPVVMTPEEIEAYKKANGHAEGIRRLLITAGEEGISWADLHCFSETVFGPTKKGTTASLQGRVRMAVKDNGSGGWNARHGYKTKDLEGGKIALVK